MTDPILTNHAKERIGQRGLTRKIIIDTFFTPDKTFPGRVRESFEYQKKYGKSTVSVIAKQNEKKEWIILSCWIDPPLPGSIDIKRKQEYIRYRKASFWGKFWLVLKKQLGF